MSETFTISVGAIIFFKITTPKIKNYLPRKAKRTGEGENWRRQRAENTKKTDESERRRKHRRQIFI